MTHARAQGRRIVVVDGGARRGLSLLKPLHARLVVHAFEPDETACAALAATPHPHAALIPHAAALAATSGTATLHIARSPSLSSLLEPDLDAYRRHFGRMADFPRWARAIETVDTRTVQTVSLDDWAARADVPYVDLLKLDTQGTELDVLRGATRLLAQGRIGVIYTEVSFLPVYKGQQLFTDLDQHLKASGYVYVDCRYYPHAVPPPPATRHYIEPARWGIGGDATYACDAAGWNETERRDRVDVTGEILTHLGTSAGARDWLRSSARIAAPAADAAVACWEAGARAGRLARLAHTWLPEALRTRWRVG
jgi:FkbM family methyltransferase